MQEVVRQLSERLVLAGHDVTVATTFLPERSESLLRGVRVMPFRIRGNWAIGCAGETERYREFLVESDFDIITDFAAQQWTTDLALDLFDRIRAPKVFVPTGFSKLGAPRYREYYRLMPRWMRQYGMNVFHSQRYRDIQFARASGVDRWTVIPNGAARDEFAPRAGPDIRRMLGIPGRHLLVLHVGAHTGTKGHRAAIEIFHRARLRDATFLLVAGASRRGCARRCRLSALADRLSADRLLRGSRLLVAELSRAETVAAYHAADMFLFPSAVECSPLVLFECLASRTPFLSTDVGNAAEIIEWSKGGLLLPTIHDSKGDARADLSGSADLLRRIASQPEQRRALAASGYQAWEERFSWERIVPLYERLYQTLIEEQP